MPVGATTTTLRSVSAMKRRISVDLPVPALPVRNTCRPPPSSPRAFLNSSVRMSCGFRASVTATSPPRAGPRYRGLRHLVPKGTGLRPAISTVLDPYIVAMTYVISSACVDVMHKSCVQECPVDCIYEGARSMYINPDECVDCGACKLACEAGA